MIGVSYIIYVCDLYLWTYLCCLLLPYMNWCDGHDGTEVGVLSMSNRESMKIEDQRMFVSCQLSVQGEIFLT